jgi:hypothetical protein
MEEHTRDWIRLKRVQVLMKLLQQKYRPQVTAKQGHFPAVCRIAHLQNFSSREYISRRGTSVYYTTLRSFKQQNHYTAKPSYSWKALGYVSALCWVYSYWTIEVQPPVTFLKVVTVHTMKKYKVEGGRGIAPLLLNVRARRKWVVNITPRPFYPQLRNTIPVGGSVGPRTCLDVFQNTKISHPYQDTNPGETSP